MHYYTKNIADFNNATRHLTRQERSIYSDLLELQYDLETPLPNDLDWICRRILATSESERTDVERTLNEYFHLVERGWSNARCEAEIERYNTKIHQAKAAGKASGEARRRNKKPNEIKQKERNGNGRLTGVERALNQPLTINQEPITNIVKGKFKKPTLEEVEKAFELKGVDDPKKESESFYNFYESKGWMVGKNKMQKWRSSVALWANRLRGDEKPEQQQGPFV